jgi:hypothetical protein
VGAPGRPGQAGHADRVPVPRAAALPAHAVAEIVPNCKKLGPLDNGDSWLRDRFAELGVIEFEDLPDTGEEFGSLQLA